MKKRNAALSFASLAAILLMVGCASAPNFPGNDLMAGGLLGDIRGQGGEGWELVDGTVTSVRGEDMSFVVTASAYSDFELNVEFYVEGSTNSGVFARCANSQAISPVDCYEFNIWDSHQNAESKTGAIVRFSGPQAEVSTEDKWNTMRIVAVGDHLQVWVNGTMTNDIIDDTFDAGVIGLQYGGANGLVKFRNLYVEDLSAAM